jgi:hypothetical protein
VVSTGAQTPASFGFQSPGDYATCNSNHTPDGTADRPTMGQLHSVICHYYPHEDHIDHPEYTVAPVSSSPEQIYDDALEPISSQAKIKTNPLTNNL